MACERYREDLLEAAAGWLEPEREMRFDAHRRACPACLGEFERLRRLFAVLEDGLDARVNDELPKGFAARVRARVTEQTTPRVRWVPAGGAVAAVAALVVAVAVGHFWRSGRTPNNMPNQAAAKAPPSETPIRAGAPPPAAAVQTARRNVRQPRQHLAAKITAPQVLLPPGHRQAMARLVEGLHAGEVPAGMLLAESREGGALVIEPLTIRPLELKPLENAAQGPGVGPARNRN